MRVASSCHRIVFFLREFPCPLPSNGVEEARGIDYFDRIRTDRQSVWSYTRAKKIIRVGDDRDSVKIVDSPNCVVSRQSSGNGLLESEPDYVPMSRRYFDPRKDDRVIAKVDGKNVVVGYR